MNRKLKISSVFCIGVAAAIFIANAPPQHQVAAAPPPQIRPVCDFVPVGKDAPPSASETTKVEPVVPESDTLTVPMLDAAPESQPIAQLEETSQPPSSLVAQVQSVSSPLDEPKMGDTRTVDGQKQVYFLGFGWIEDNDEPNVCIVVVGDGDINKMVGTMDGGEVGRSCGDINKMVGVMGE